MQIQFLVLSHGDRFAVVVALNYLAAKIAESVYLRLAFCTLRKTGKAKFFCESNGMDYVRELRVIEWRKFSDFAREAEKDADAYFKSLYGRDPEPSDRTGKEWGNYLYFYLYEVRLK